MREMLRDSVGKRRRFKVRGGKKGHDRTLTLRLKC